MLVTSTATIPFSGSAMPHCKMPMAYFSYEGLDPTNGSITIEIDICYQTLVDPDSQLLPFAQPSAMGDPTFLQRAITFMSNQPAVKSGAAAIGNAMYAKAMQ